MSPPPLLNGSGMFFAHTRSNTSVRYLGCLFGFALLTGASAFAATAPVQDAGWTLASLGDPSSRSRFEAPESAVSAGNAGIRSQSTTSAKPASSGDEGDLWQDYYGWRELDDIEQAHAVAGRLVKQAEEHLGKRSIGYAQALAELGATHVLLGRGTQGLVMLKQAESILARQTPLFSQELLTILEHLGAALQATGRHSEAIDAFTRAQHLTHRLWGTTNKEQIDLAYARADSLQAVGEHAKAERLQRFVYELHRTHYGDRSTEAIKASARYGTWLRNTGNYHESLYHFKMALAELHDGGPDTPESIPLLHGLAHAYRGGYRGRYAGSMHKRVIEVVATFPDRFTLDERVRAHLDYGDWLMQRFYERRAVRQYETAWQLASDSGAAGESWLEVLSKPKLVRYGEMAPRDISGANRYVSFQFDLKADGRARRIKVKDFNCTGRDRYLAKLIFPSDVRYRPAIVDGRAVPHAGQTETMYLIPMQEAIEAAPLAAGAANRMLGNALLEPSNTFSNDQP